MAPRGGGSQSYGFPIYCAAWLPLSHILEPDSPADDADASSSPLPPMAVLGGGGGEGRSGVPNKLVVAALDPSAAAGEAPALSTEPVFKKGTEEVPYRMAVHPRGDGVIIAFPNGCRCILLLQPVPSVASAASHALLLGLTPTAPYDISVDCFSGQMVEITSIESWHSSLAIKDLTVAMLYRWTSQEREEPHKLALKSNEEALMGLKGVGLQLAVSFNGEGSVFATGGVDGHLRVFKWPGPAMEPFLTEADTKTSIKDLTFSSDEKFLAVIRSSSPCTVWNLQSSEVVANLPREAGEIFGFCRFSNKTDSSHILFVTVTAMQGDYGKIISWNTTSWTKIGSKKITREAISAFAVSPDGALLAIGTTEGSIIVLGSKNMQTLITVKKAHLGIVTTIAFSQDSGTLLSTSFDSTARVTPVGSPKSNGTSVWPMILVIILAILVYYCMQHKEDLLAMLPR